MRYKIAIEKPCTKCGTVDQWVTAGKGPHAYGLRCTGCDYHTWLDKISATTLWEATKYEPS